MVLFISYLIVVLWIKRELSNNDRSEKIIFVYCSLIGIVLAVIYRLFLINVGIKYGLANLDMKNYMRLAEQVCYMPINDGLKIIASDWAMIKTNYLQMGGYCLYIYYLSYAVFRWSFFSVETSVYLVSFLQILISSLSTLIIYNTIKERHFPYAHLSFVLMLIAPPIWFGSVRLLREALMFLCMALIIRFYLRKSPGWIWQIAIPTIILTINRPYYTLFMVPLSLLLDDKIKKANIVNSIIFAGLAAVCISRQISILDILGVVLSPNFFNQVHQLNVSAIDSVLSTGRIPIIDYIGAVWNLLMLVFTILALISKKRRSASVCSIAIMLDVCMVYAIVYGGITELRHKMFFVIPYIILLNNGLDKIKNNKSIILLLLMVILFIIVYSSVIILIGR